jgi:hypothetical protein
VTDCQENRLRNLLSAAVCEARAFGVAEDVIRSIVREIFPDRTVEYKPRVMQTISGEGGIMSAQPVRKRRGRPPKAPDAQVAEKLPKDEAG